MYFIYSHSHNYKNQLFLFFPYYSDNTKTTVSNSTALGMMHCQGTNAVFLSTAYMIVRSLLLAPVSIVVVHLGYQRWRQQRSFATISHADIFVYHKLAFDLFSTVGIVFFHCGALLGMSGLWMVGVYLSCFDIPSQTLLHILTCIERYLAVVHPVTYRRLKQSGGVRVRNISLGCVWLQSFVWIGLVHRQFPNPPVILNFLLLTTCFIIASFCSIRVLCILIHPGPGDAPGHRVKVDQFKQKAFNMITIITAIIWLYFIGITICIALDYSGVLGYIGGCYILISALWLNLPCNMLLPILFLQRSGKLSCCHWSQRNVNNDIDC